MNSNVQNLRFKSDAWAGKDLLGREIFAAHLAQRIQAWRGKESLVIGLCGEWGNGKTVTKEMILRKLRTDKVSCPLILEFNSWEWSGHDLMTAALFKQIRTSLGQKDAGEAAHNAAGLLKFYESYLKTAVIGLEGLSTALDNGLKLFAIAAFTVSTAVNSTVVKWIGFALGGIALILPFLKLWGTFLKSLAETHAADAERNRKTLEELKTEISESLLKLKKPLLIIVDDVDRLSADEIKILFQLVKANVNFPNIIYFLIFQKDIIESALEVTFKVSSGKEYLKKIIQVGFDLPIIERRRLNDFLKEELETLISSNGLTIDSTRLNEAFQEGFNKMFKNLRDIHRFLVTLDFHLGLFKQNGALEVDCVDLAVLVALRQYEEQVYQKIPTVRNALLRQSENYFTKDEVKDEDYKSAIELLVKCASEQNQPCVKDALTLLFPASFHANHQNVDKWFREFRICDSDGFERYFLLTVPIGAVSKSEVDKIKSAVGDTVKLSDILKQFHSQNRLYDLLRYLNASVDEIDITHITSVFTALFNSEDCFERSTSDLGWVTFTTADISQRIIFGFLSRVSDVTKRAEWLLKSINESSGVYLPVRIVSLEVARRARYPENCALSESDLPALKEACLVKIRGWANSSDCQKHPHLTEIIGAWKSWDTTNAVSLWTERVISTKDGLLAFLHAFLEKIEMNSPFTDDHLLPAITFLEWFIPLNQVSKKIEEFALKNNDDLCIEIFQSGVKLKRKADSEKIKSLPNRQTNP